MSKRANRTLGVVLLLLIGLTALVLLMLRGTEEPQPVQPAQTHQIGPAPAPTPPPRRRPPPRLAPDSGPRMVRRAVPAAEVDAGPARREPLGVHSAPAAVPVEIAEEKDPERRAQLMRMHQLAVARSRASRLRRRRRLLSTTLRRARQEKNWDAARLHRTENEIKELERAVEQAEERVRSAEKRVKQGGKR